MTQPSQAELFAALQASSFRPKSSINTVTFATLSNPSQELIESSSGSSSKTNTRKVYCYREGCGSLILLPGAGEWVETTEYVIPHEEKSPFPQPVTTTQSHAYWHVPDPFSFENIGFSKADSKTTASLPSSTPGLSQGKQVKWLICAECDLGPIGWGFEGSKDAWLAIDRVRYSEK